MAVSQSGPPTGGPNDLLGAAEPARSEITTVELQDIAELGDRVQKFVDGDA